ncbi:MAG: Hsp20/alpha crystallin family protein [Deltaproteobacteria bacterium]|nr:Hsp20/alpha crystallin family protein [Deltaproteobacteria bacterium]
MLRNKSNELQKVEKGAAPAVPEQTHTGPVYTPAVDIFESEDRISLLADMPGVEAEDLKIDLRENVLTLAGHVASPEADNETPVLREYAPGSYFRQFTLSEHIDQAKIDAKLTDGVLRLELPKVERAKPRQITVKSG